ncbi:MAG TPA: isopentenyl-diphosphate delta-isomerase [Saprospiraceae bacterium]|nr:isopentenyl-diphosphate delta-isomerase [Saprospiraceae bacterium]HNT20306.1 isopentenyl-diphosphate delta-isomerase [Saprospiraceae bacterium]
MEEKQSPQLTDQRKKDHLDLALQSRMNALQADERFYYEPLLSGHPSHSNIPETPWDGKVLKNPIWISSMTGGTAEAVVINERLARICKAFGLGMGLGSCRILLDSDQYLSDFKVRKFMGDQPLYANLGIAQVEQILLQEAWDKIERLIERLEADGLIIHVNPLQEWLQPEGDPILHPPLQTIVSTLQNIKAPLIVKEVGQGMGPESLEALLKLPLAAIEFAALGGTNFSTLEMKRRPAGNTGEYDNLSRVGHTAGEMTRFVNEIVSRLGDQVKCGSVIISGGIKDFLDGYYYMQKLRFKSVYGQASGFLQPARKSYDALYDHARGQIDGLQMAYGYLRVR